MNYFRVKDTDGNKGFIAEKDICGIFYNSYCVFAYTSTGDTIHLYKSDIRDSEEERLACCEKAFNRFLDKIEGVENNRIIDTCAWEV